MSTMQDAALFKAVLAAVAQGTMVLTVHLLIPHRPLLVALLYGMIKATQTFVLFQLSPWSTAVYFPAR